MSTAHQARALADIEAGKILASIEIRVPPERVFRALTSAEVAKWWGSDDTYRTNEFVADVRVGGKWKATGKSAKGEAYTVHGEYLEVDPPRKIVHTWISEWDTEVTTVTYLLDATESGTRVTLRHEGFVGRPQSCAGHANGWERVLGWLSKHFPPSAEAPARQVFLCRLLPPRPSFPFDMSAAERTVMLAHVGYWQEKLKQGVAVVFGPVADPKGPWGLGVVRVADAAELEQMKSQDPAILAGLGFSYESVPMLNAVFKE